MKQLVVYTCVTGGYDAMLEPYAPLEGVDFVYFTDSPAESTVWDVRPIGHPQADDVLTVRWYKMNPHLLFPEYRYSLWLDGNIRPASDEFLPILEEAMNAGCLWSGIRHPRRDDVYEEAYRILSNGRERLGPLLRTVRFLRKEGFPEHWGMMECNVILRKHGEGKVVAADELWWSLFRTFCRRDQMTQTYCLWKTGLDMEYLLPEGFSARNHPAFEYVPHDGPYVKDRSLKGLARDAAMYVKKLIFRISVKF